MAAVGDTGAVGGTVLDNDKGELLPISLPVCHDEVQGEEVQLLLLLFNV